MCVTILTCAVVGRGAAACPEASRVRPRSSDVPADIKDGKGGAAVCFMLRGGRCGMYRPCVDSADTLTSPRYLHPLLQIRFRCNCMTALAVVKPMIV